MTNMDPTNLMVYRTLTFLRELKRTYGADKTTEVWNAVSDTIGDSELTFKVFKILLNGGYGINDFTIRSWNSPWNSSGSQLNGKITAIKILRSWTRCGLKEAKAATEMPSDQTVKMKIHQEYDENNIPIDIDYDKFENDMESAGFIIDIELE